MSENPTHPRILIVFLSFCYVITLSFIFAMLMDFNIQNYQDNGGFSELLFRVGHRIFLRLFRLKNCRATTIIEID